MSPMDRYKHMDFWAHQLNTLPHPNNTNILSVKEENYTCKK